MPAYKQLNKPRSSRLRWIILAVLLIVLLAGAAWYFLVRKDTVSQVDNTKPTTTENITYNPPTEEEKQEAEANKIDKGNTSVDPGTTGQPAPQTVEIISIAQEGAGQSVVVKTKLPGSGWGKCSLTFTQGSASFTETADSLYQEEFSTCLGFDVPASKFPAGGTWQAKLTATNGSGTPASATKSVSVAK